MEARATCVAPAPRWARPARRSLGPCAALRVSAAAVLAFERLGSVKLTQLLPADELEVWSQQLREAMHREELTSLKQNAKVLLGEEALTDTFGGHLDGDELAELLRVNGVEVPFMQVGRRGGGGGRAGASSVQLPRFLGPRRSRRGHGRAGLVGGWARRLVYRGDCSWGWVQVFNLWRKDCDAAARLAFSEELRDAAAELLGCERSQLRLYQVSVHRLVVTWLYGVPPRDLMPKPSRAQDSIFHKRLGDAPTRWHCDLNMAPLDTNRFLTVRMQAAAMQHAHRNPPRLKPTSGMQGSQLGACVAAGIPPAVEAN